MKLTAITAIGSYFSPWYPYGVASVYDVVDEIIVVNNGLNLTGNGSPTDLVPLEEVGQWNKVLDPNGKIMEVKSVDPKKLRHSYPVGTQRAANLRRKGPGGEGNWYDIRGLNLTAAQELAVDRGADWILKFDTDEVCYANVAALRRNLPATLLFYQYEFAGDLGYGPAFLADPPPASPWIDTMQTYRADPDIWYLGAGAIAGIKEERRPTSTPWCAHLREANPVWLTEEEKLQHFVGRVAWRLYTNDYGYFSGQLLAQALEMAKAMFVRKMVPSGSVQPPEVCAYEDPSEYLKR